jgi:hypothetical protein
MIRVLASKGRRADSSSALVPRHAARIRDRPVITSGERQARSGKIAGE